MTPEYPSEKLMKLFTEQRIMELHHEAASHGLSTGTGLRDENQFVFEDMLSGVHRLIQQKKSPSQISAFIAKIIMPKGGIEDRPRMFADANHRTTWLIITMIYDCFGEFIKDTDKHKWELMDPIDRMTEREIREWLDNHFPLKLNFSKNDFSSLTCSRNRSSNQTSNSSSDIDSNMLEASINSLPNEDVPRVTPWWRTKVLEAPIDHPGWALFGVIIMAGAGLLLREMAKAQMKVSEEVPHALPDAK